MAILNAILLSLIGREFAGQIERLAAWILKRSVDRVPAQIRSQYANEWPAHFNECPGPISKLWHAAGCWFAAPKVQYEPIPFTSYIAFMIAGLFWIIFLVHLNLCRATAKLMIVTLIIMRRWGWHEAATRRYRRRTVALVAYTRLEKGVVITLGVCSSAGLRLGKHSSHNDVMRSYLVGFGFFMACAYIKGLMARQGDIAVIRPLLGIHVVNNPDYRGTDAFERWAAKGLSMRESAMELGSVLTKLNILLDTLADSASGDALINLRDLQKRISG